MPEHPGLVSVVVPVCNEESYRPEFRARLAAALAPREFECILVDENSTDVTPAMIRDIAREDPCFKRPSLSRNFGHQAAIFACLTFARGACVAVMDGDLQDPPELIPEMVRLRAQGAEAVYSVRPACRDAWHKRVAAAIFVHRPRPPGGPEPPESSSSTTSSGWIRPRCHGTGGGPARGRANLVAGEGDFWPSSSPRSVKEKLT